MPHRTGSTTPDVLPDFPAHLPQAPIQRISLDALLNRDSAASADLWTACSTHGFFYLDMTTCDKGRMMVSSGNALERLSHDAFRIPLEQKQEAAMAKWRTLFGYKGAGAVAQADEHKRKDKGEFWNVSKDDMLGQSESPVPYPSMIKDQASLFQNFSTTAHSIGMVVLEILAGKLGVTAEDLLSRHKITSKSGDHVRLTFGPGDPEAAKNEATSSEKDTAITTFAHTDFGSVTLLFNWLGGLQVENRAQNQWEWVKPFPGHAICNLGDAMVQFSGGRVSSGKHRVVAAPGEQAQYDRYSVVYFVRPEDDVFLEDLTPGAVRLAEGERWRAGEWINERAKQLGNQVGKKD